MYKLSNNITFFVDDGGAVFVVLVPADPHFLKSSEFGEHGSATPRGGPQSALVAPHLDVQTEEPPLQLHVQPGGHAGKQTRPSGEDHLPG